MIGNSNRVRPGSDRTPSGRHVRGKGAGRPTRWRGFPKAGNLAQRLCVRGKSCKRIPFLRKRAADVVKAHWSDSRLGCESKAPSAIPRERREA